MNCIYCNETAIKKGRQSNQQRYQCKTCKKYFQDRYSYRRYTAEDERMIYKLNRVGVGICGMAEYIEMPKASVVNKIDSMASRIQIPELTEENQRYQADELFTFIKKKENKCCVMYAINERTKAVVNLVTGGRTTINIKKVIDKVLNLQPKKISTDGLNIYASLIEKGIHKVKRFGINKIERMNLTLRTRVKRISRRTICFSKSERMLGNCIKLFLWGDKLFS